MATERFGVKNRQTGQFFAGFCNNDALWTDDESQARAFGSMVEATAQASLFRRFDISAQLKPVSL